MREKIFKEVVDFQLSTWSNREGMFLSFLLFFEKDCNLEMIRGRGLYWRGVTLKGVSTRRSLNFSNFILPFFFKKKKKNFISILIYLFYSFFFLNLLQLSAKINIVKGVRDVVTKKFFFKLCARAFI